MKIDYSVRKSRKRKRTVALKITDEGKIVVLASYKMTGKEIERFILAKQKWIEKHLNHIKNLQQIKKERKFTEGERFLYLGKEYPLHIKTKINEKLLFSNNEFILNNKYIKKAKELFIKWYKDRAYMYISDIVKEFSNNWNIKYKNIKIIKAKSRWGSCSSDNSLHFNYKIIMAPPVIVKYVIVHEMMHIIEKNHSKKFWKNVEKVMPNYKKYRKWLRDNGHLLII